MSIHIFLLDDPWLQILGIGCRLANVSLTLNSRLVCRIANSLLKLDLWMSNRHLKLNIPEDYF